MTEKTRKIEDRRKICAKSDIDVEIQLLDLRWEKVTEKISRNRGVCVNAGLFGHC